MLAVWEYSPDDAYLSAHCAASRSRLPLFNPTDLSLVIWATSKLAYLPPKTWMRAWLEQSRKV